jgi:hypothetical protein
MFYGNWRFITMFTTAHYFSIPWARYINSTHKNITNLFRIPFNFSPKNGKCSAQIFHDFIMLMIYAGNTYRKRTQYAHFFLPSVTFSFLGTNVFPGHCFQTNDNLFDNICSYHHSILSSFACYVYLNHNFPLHVPVVFIILTQLNHYHRKI